MGIILSNTVSAFNVVFRLCIKCTNISIFLLKFHSWESSLQFLLLSFGKSSKGTWLYFSVEFRPTISCIIQSPLFWGRWPSAVLQKVCVWLSTHSFCSYALKSSWDQHPLWALPFRWLNPNLRLCPTVISTGRTSQQLSSLWEHSPHPRRLPWKSTQALTHKPLFSPLLLSVS